MQIMYSDSILIIRFFAYYVKNYFSKYIIINKCFEIVNIFIKFT